MPAPAKETGFFAETGMTSGARPSGVGEKAVRSLLILAASRRDASITLGVRDPEFGARRLWPICLRTPDLEPRSPSVTHPLILGGDPLKVYWVFTPALL